MPIVDYDGLAIDFGAHTKTVSSSVFVSYISIGIFISNPIRLFRDVWPDNRPAEQGVHGSIGFCYQVDALMEFLFPIFIDAGVSEARTSDIVSVGRHQSHHDQGVRFAFIVISTRASKLGMERVISSGVESAFDGLGSTCPVAASAATPAVCRI